MLTTTILVMVIAVVAVLFGGLALMGRERSRTHSIASGGNDMSWSPAFYSGDGGASFGGHSGSGDSGCDAGGGDAGGGSDGGGCDGGGGGGD
jgi:uncharacterized membrane protein YgcG